MSPPESAETLNATWAPPPCAANTRLRTASLVSSWITFVAATSPSPRPAPTSAMPPSPIASTWSRAGERQAGRFRRERPDEHRDRSGPQARVPRARSTCSPPPPSSVSSLPSLRVLAVEVCDRTAATRRRRASRRPARKTIRQHRRRRRGSRPITPKPGEQAPGASPSTLRCPTAVGSTPTISAQTTKVAASAARHRRGRSAGAEQQPPSSGPAR